MQHIQTEVMNLTARIKMYGAMNFVNDFVADRNIMGTHYSLTDFLYKEHNSISVQFIATKQKINMYVSQEVAKLTQDSNIGKESLVDLINQHVIYKQHVFEQLQVAMATSGFC